MPDLISDLTNPSFTELSTAFILKVREET